MTFIGFFFGGGTNGKNIFVFIRPKEIRVLLTYLGTMADNGKAKTNNTWPLPIL